MLWFSFALFGYSCLAIVAIFDKFILSNEKIKPIMFVFFSSVFLSPLILLFPFLKNYPNALDLAVILLGSFGFVFSLGTMYLAYLKSEVSHSGPFIGALIPLFILVLSRIFLSEVIGGSQVVGIFLLSFGTFAISFQGQKESGSWRDGLTYAMVSAFLYAIFHVSAKYLYTSLGFYSGFVLLWGSVGVIGLLMFALPDVRASVFPKKNIFKIIFEKILPHRQVSNKQFAVVAFDKVLSVVGIVSIQYAVSLGSVAKVNALSGAQYALLVIIVALSSKFFPAVFKESYERGEMVRELAAVSVIAAGLVFLIR